MMRTRIKICGLSQPDDISTAVNAGVDAIGLMHFEKSPRYVELEKAVALRSAIPAFVSVVSVVVNAEKEFISTIIEKVRPDYIQFHGDESPEFCAQFNYPFIRAVRVREQSDISAAFERYHQAKALLLDAYNERVFGGLGESFDWRLIPQSMRPKIILAGGLHSANVVKAIDEINPFAVDVSSGVEREAGVKDGRKIVEFIDAVNATLRR